jgi:hypothetical protein
MSQVHDGSGADLPQRLPYVVPRLTIFGPLALATLAVGTMGTLRDMAGNGNNKTR